MKSKRGYLGGIIIAFGLLFLFFAFAIVTVNIHYSRAQALCKKYDLEIDSGMDYCISRGEKVNVYQIVWENDGIFSKPKLGRIVAVEDLQ